MVGALEGYFVGVGGWHEALDGVAFGGGYAVYFTPLDVIGVPLSDKDEGALGDGVFGVHRVNHGAAAGADKEIALLGAHAWDYNDVRWVVGFQCCAESC